MTDEPVLSELTQRIAEDEINHYKHFFRYLRKYRKREGQRRIGIVQALWNRLRMIDGADSRIAMHHIYHACHPGQPFNERIFRELRRGSRALIRPHFPHRMCIQMLLTPLCLPRRAQRLVIRS